MNIDTLALDATNPRLDSFENRQLDQKQLVKILWQDFNASEIAESIIASGEFWPHEPLFACTEQGRNVVLKGNRRVAAVNVIVSRRLQQELGIRGLPRISERLQMSLLNLPVVFVRREALWPFLGFHGIKSAQEWDLLAKAKYVVRLHDERQVALVEIAKAIADRNGAILRLYETAKVLEQAESAGAFDSSDVFFQRKGFALVHLFAALGF